MGRRGVRGTIGFWPCLSRHARLTRRALGTWECGWRLSFCLSSLEARVRSLPTCYSVSLSVFNPLPPPTPIRKLVQVAKTWLPHLPPRTSLADSVVVQAVVLRADADGVLEVLLIHRVSPRAWEIPGGRPEAGEHPSRAVEREVLEESGLTVRATRLVGTFRRSGYRPHLSPVYRCVIVSGVPHPNEEAIEASFHRVDRLPWGVFPWLREAIDLAIADFSAPQRCDASSLVRHQHLGFGALAQSLLIHMAGVARLRA
jgi:8-oxo-dGTP pyrophosphatase MutT (NUDIX family)